MHAVVYEVAHKQGWEGDVEGELDMIVEGGKQTEGFVSGLWLSDGETGLAIIVVQSEDVAKAEAENAAVIPEASITLQSAKAFEVKRTA